VSSWSQASASTSGEFRNGSTFARLLGRLLDRCANVLHVEVQGTARRRCLMVSLAQGTGRHDGTHRSALLLPRYSSPGAALAYRTYPRRASM
jgi:hypothetical protein